MSRERTALLRTYGAEVHETPSLGGMNESVELANRLAKENDGFIPQQFSNPANPEIHRRTTAEEIWRDLDGQVDAFVAGVGTGGTITGVGQVLKERRPDIRSSGSSRPTRPCSPAESRARTRSRGSAPGFVPEVLDRDVIDEIVAVRTRTPLETAPASAPARGAADRHLGRRRGTRRARPRRPGRDERQADRGDRPRLGERYMSLPFFAP